MVAAALEGVAGGDKSRHLFVELIAPSFLFGFHLLAVVLHEGDILHVLFLRPFPTFFTTNIVVLLQNHLFFHFPALQANLLRLSTLHPLYY